MKSHHYLHPIPPRRPQAKMKALDERAEDEILRRAERVDAQLVRVEALRSTAAVLRKAGFVNVIPFHRYLVPIEWADGGMLCVKTSSDRKAAGQ